MPTSITIGSTPSLVVPATQNTALVFEFNCLYTHDVRRKSKRWQDGFLRFHTFNKRIMVYDVPRNFIGDAHWTSEELLQEGDELTLDREAVLVQVAESVGQTQTDLTELRKNKKKVAVNRDLSSPARGPGAPASVPTTRTPLQSKHRSLNALLAVSKAPIGKALLPAKSPFEVRQQNIDDQDWSPERVAKRRRTEERVAVGNKYTMRDPAHHGKPHACEPAKTLPRDKQRTSTAPLPHATRDKSRHFIDLSSDQEDTQDQFLSVHSSNPVEPPSSPVKGSSASERKTRDVSERKHNRTSPVSAQMVTAAPISNESDNDTTLHPHETNDAQNAKTLRSAAIAPKRRMLTCHETMKSSPSSYTTQQEQLEERLAKMAQKRSYKVRGNDRREPLTGLQENKTAAPERQATTEILRTTDAEQIQPSIESSSAVKFPRAPSVDTGVTENLGRQEQHQAHVQLSNSDKEADLVRHPPIHSPADSMPANVSLDNNPSPDVVSNGPTVHQYAKEEIPLKDVTESLIVRNPKPNEDAPRQATTSSKPTRLPADRKRNGIGRREIRKTAAACFPTLDTSANGTSSVILSRQFQPPRPPSKAQPPAIPVDAHTGPWSREAFDLFTWRPPGWDEENWCLKAV